jgi:hypothetical protein
MAHSKDAQTMWNHFPLRLAAAVHLAVWMLACTIAAASAANDPIDSAADTPADVTALKDGTKYDLRYKLATGDVLRYSVAHRAAIRSTIDETTQEAQTKTDSVKLWKITDVLPNGDVEIMNVVEQVHMVNQLPDRAQTEYDSQRDKTPPPGYEDAARAIGVPLSVVRITPRGEIVSHVVKHQQSAAEPDAQMAVRFPDQPVAVGATWDEPFDVTVQLEGGATKSIQTRRHYELTNVSGGIATIAVAYQILSPIDAAIESQLVQRLMKGTVLFDIERGRIESQQYEIDKRILGFAGPTSSMHYVMRMEEKLAAAEKFVPTPQQAARQLPAPIQTPTASPAPPPRRTTASPRRPPSRSANRFNPKGRYVR